MLAESRIRLALVAASLWLGSQPLAAQGKRVATIDDLMRLKTVTEVQLSPDGSKVAYVVSVPVVDKNAHDSDIWMVAASGGEPVQLTNSPKGDQSPRWSPDGRRIAFVSMRDGPPNIYLLDLRGGEARKLTKMEGGVEGFAWSPDGGRIAFISADPPGEERKKATEATAGVVVVDEYFPMSRLRVVDVASEQVTTLTGSDRHVTALSWAPDGPKYPTATGAICWWCRPTVARSAHWSRGKGRMDRRRGRRTAARSSSSPAAGGTSWASPGSTP